MLEAFSRRLREARTELRYDQMRFAQLGGVKKNSQINYEAGRTAPPVDYLLRLAEHGVDIGYVLTGQRTDGSLSLEQQLLFDAFGQLSARECEAIMAMVLTLAGQTTSTAEIGAQARAGREQLGTLHDRKQDYRTE